MKLLYGCPELVAAWVKARLPTMQREDSFGEFTAIGVTVDNRLAAGFIYNNWQPRYRSIEMSIAADTPKWISKNIVHNLLAYPFWQLNINRLVLVTAADNIRACRLGDGLGFVREAEMKEFFGDKDAVAFRMFRRDWERSKFCLRRKDDEQKGIEAAETA